MKRKLILSVACVAAACCAMAQQQSDCPNWFYYWSQTDANGAKGLTMIYSDGTPGGTSFYYPTGDIIFIGDGAALEPKAAWGIPKGIDYFAWVTRHEAKHRAQYRFFWPNGVYDGGRDLDDDLIPDDMEKTYMPGRPYDPNNQRTYKDTTGHSSDQNSFILDIEDICMRSQTPVIDGVTTNYPIDILWINGSADHQDWSNPGKQSKNKY